MPGTDKKWAVWKWQACPLQVYLEYVDCGVQHNREGFMYKLSNEDSSDQIADYFSFRMVVFLILK